MFETTCKPSKTFLEHYFTSLLKDLSNKNLVTLCELLVTEIAKPRRRLYATLKREAWLPQHDINKVLEALMN
jgi:hypothetical protein